MIMYTRLCFSLLLAFLSSLALAAANDERTVDIFAWPSSDSKPQSFAKISYTSENATIKSHNAPKIPANDDIVRVGFNRPSGDWSGIATAASNFGPGKNQKLRLHVNQEGELYHVGFALVKEGFSQGKGNSQDDGLFVEVVPILPGPAPQLSKPVVVTADGDVENKVPDQTFFQKYWWVMALFLVMQLVVGGGGKEEKKE